MDAISVFGSWGPGLLTLGLAVLVLSVANWFLFQRPVTGVFRSRLVRQLAMLALTGVMLVAFLLTLPIEAKVQERFLQVLGLLFTVVLAFSSTSFVSNAVAGLMLRAVRNFAPGDFIRVGDHFGRVTERGLFHTEIQTEESDLTTLPNLLLVSTPVKVVRSSGTIVSVELSLGYDVARQKVEPLLIEAAGAVGLERAFVQVRELLDHAVVYRVSGWLEDVSDLPFAGPRVRAAVLDHLHGAGIEIASPSIMSQRPLPSQSRIIPKERVFSEPNGETQDAEKMAFDKAERAAQLTQLHEEVAGLDDQIDAVKREIKKSGDDDRQAEVDRLTARRDATAARIAAAEDVASK